MQEPRPLAQQAAAFQGYVADNDGMELGQGASALPRGGHAVSTRLSVVPGVDAALTVQGRIGWFQSCAAILFSKDDERKSIILETSEPEEKEN